MLFGISLLEINAYSRFLFKHMRKMNRIFKKEIASDAKNGHGMKEIREKHAKQIPFWDGNTPIINNN